MHEELEFLAGCLDSVVAESEGFLDGLVSGFDAGLDLVGRLGFAFDEAVEGGVGAGSTGAVLGGDLDGGTGLVVAGGAEVGFEVALRFDGEVEQALEPVLIFRIRSFKQVVEVGALAGRREIELFGGAFAEGNVAGFDIEGPGSEFAGIDGEVQFLVEAELFFAGSFLLQDVGDEV